MRLTHSFYKKKTRWIRREKLDGSMCQNTCALGLRTTRTLRAKAFDGVAPLGGTALCASGAAPAAASTSSPRLPRSVLQQLDSSALASGLRPVRLGSSLRALGWAGQGLGVRIATGSPSLHCLGWHATLPTGSKAASSHFALEWPRERPKRQCARTIHGRCASSGLAPPPWASIMVGQGVFINGKSDDVADSTTSNSACLRRQLM